MSYVLFWTEIAVVSRALHTKYLVKVRVLTHCATHVSMNHVMSGAVDVVEDYTT